MEHIHQNCNCLTEFPNNTREHYLNEQEYILVH